MQVAAVQSYMEDLIEAEEKFLLFAHHTCLLDAAEATCRKKKVGSPGRTHPHLKLNSKIL